jgi:hypothetical protein
MDKIEKVENLIFSELIDTVYNLTNRLGYENLTKADDVITASLKNPLITEKIIFIFLKERLTGVTNIELIKNQINVNLKAHQPNIIFIVSQNNISSGFKTTISRLYENFTLNFIDRDDLIKLLNENYADFWKHNDLMLIEYEKQFNQNSLKETDLKKLKIFNDKYLKLLEIYIDPRIYQFYEDKKTKTPVRKKVSIDDILQELNPSIISGDAGTGKSTILKKIGEALIEKNLQEETKNVPVFITVTEIFENDYKIADLTSKKIKSCFPSLGWTEFLTNYKITILVDSLDELEEEIQKSILKELNRLSESGGIRYIIATRNQERLSSLNDGINFNIYSIERFNTEQIKKFSSKFFVGANKRADDLIDALKENRIIERLPITPLTLSLISILYEENNLEIPATIADIYDNFNSLIIGRSTVTSRLEFIDVSFKERILSLYALHLLEKSQHTPLSKEDFFTHFTEYFNGKTLPIKKGTLEEVLEYLINNTGVLVLKDYKWVQFSHDSYMEYYGAVEIFKHQRGKEQLLIDNFFENNWQNAAIFYAGKSKDLPEFLKKVIDKLKNAKVLLEYFMGVLGSGYLLQALYQTDNQLRKQAVIEALELNVKAYDTLSKLAADETLLFKSFKLPILQVINLMYFYETFNSIAVKDPLKLAFNEIYTRYQDSLEVVDAFKAIELALTLDSKRINEPFALSEIIENKNIFKDPSLYLLVDFSLGCFGNEKYKSIKNDLKKEYQTKLKESIKKLIELPANRLRFSNLDTISTEKKIRLIVEGKTDAEIIEHAFYSLTDGQSPHWKIVSAGNESGGASEVAKAISNAKPFTEPDNFIIGIFDHDAKGLQEFRGLKTSIFNPIKNDTLKKHTEYNIYALVLPIPGELEFYLQKDQPFNFFELEHYFDIQILQSNNLVEETPIHNVFRIKDSKKKDFSKYIRSQSDPTLFKGFLELFKLIDEITGISIEY